MVVESCEVGLPTTEHPNLRPCTAYEHTLVYILDLVLNWVNITRVLYEQYQASVSFRQMVCVLLGYLAGCSLFETR